MGEQLRVRVLGDFRLEGADLARLRSRKARTLLKVLALHLGRAVTVDALIDAVWTDDLPADPARDLSVLASRARGVLGNERVVRGDGGYALIADWCDRDEVVALTREAARRHTAADLSGARVAAEAAITLGAAPLLTDEPDAEWARAPRLEIATVIAEARGIAAAAALSSGQAGDAAAHARAALDHDPFDETALRVLMRAHVVAGRPASALAAYAQGRERLAEQLGVSPSVETEALHDSIVLADSSADSVEGVVAGADAVDEVEASPSLVGRDRELALLDEAFERSRRRAEIVVVSGEAGAGKTTLIEAWAARARWRGVLVLSGRAHEGLDLALQPVLDALEGSLPATALAAEAVIGSGWVGVPGPSATAAAMQQDVFNELDARLRAVTPPAGLAIVVDDVHLADPVTLAWLGSLLRRPSDHCLLVVAARRSEEDDVDVPASASIDVGPLGHDVVAALFGGDRAGVLMERTGGNALFLVELARADAGVDGGGVDEQVPATIRDAVLARLRRVGEAAASTLRTAAVLGPVIDLDLLAGVLAASPLDVLAHLDEGVRRSFLMEVSGQLMFRHDLVRAALEADATAARKAWVHREAAKLLEDRVDANPLDRARHARAAGDMTRAADALADAADVARARFDLDGAARLLDEAIATHDSAPIRLRRSRLRMARDDMTGADQDAEVALGLGAGPQALELRTWVARNRHDMDTAIRLGTAGASMAADVDDAATRASCLIAVALAHRGIGDLREAARVMSEAGALRPPQMLGLSAWEGVLRVHQGRPLEALAALEPMLGAEAGGLLSFWVEHVVQMLAHSYGHLGRAADALALLDRLDVELERRGSASRYAGLSATYRCWIGRNLAVPGADDLARSGVENGATAEIRAQSLLDLADTLLVAGHLGPAGEALAEATSGMQQRWFHNRWRAEQRAGMITARMQLAEGSSADALATATAATVAAEERGDARYATIGRLLVARAVGRLGHVVDQSAVMSDVASLPGVAALESWWLAADVADDTGLAGARTMAEGFVGALLVDAGEHSDSLRRAASVRFG